LAGDFCDVFVQYSRRVGSLDRLFSASEQNKIFFIAGLLRTGVLAFEELQNLSSPWEKDLNFLTLWHHAQITTYMLQELQLPPAQYTAMLSRIEAEPQLRKIVPPRTRIPRYNDFLG